jgi:type III restriction enzyme
VRELQQDFAEECVLSANDDSQASKNQILLNTLEDKDNRIRAIFAVQKLNEWWDVLNLFDIVRLYDARDGDRKKDGKYYAGKTTMSEAQLIGRGARYFPFVTDEALGEDKYRRKFDRTDHELKILETFYYHTSFDSRYIAEITQALREIGIMNEKEQKKFTLKLKSSFVNNTFYKEWLIYTNTRKEKWWLWIDSLQWAWIREQRFTYTLKSNRNDTIQVFEDQQARNQIIVSSEANTLSVSNISKHIIRKAIWMNDFYTFDNLQKYLWELKSIDEFMSSDRYLAHIKIDFMGSSDRIAQINNEDLLQAVILVLKQLEVQIKQQEIQYEGTKEFKPQSLQSIFKPEKEIVVDLSAEPIGYDKDWFVFEQIVWSSEEEDFMALFHKKITTLQKKYDEIYLVRSERAFAIYSFDDGQRFEPDFVLFLKHKNNKENITYQVFIEPKGDHLLVLDKRKNDFLQQIDERAEILDINFWNYKLIWLPFYNKGLEIEFELTFDDVFSLT